MCNLSVSKADLWNPACCHEARGSFQHLAGRNGSFAGLELLLKKETWYVPGVLVVRLGREVHSQCQLEVSNCQGELWLKLRGLDVSSVVCHRNHASRERTRHLTVARDHPTAAQGAPAAAAGRLETAAAAPLAAPTAPACHAGRLYAAGTVRSVRQVSETYCGC